MNLECPKCPNNNAYIQKSDGRIRFICPDCGYTGFAKNYRSELKEKNEKSED